MKTPSVAVIVLGVAAVAAVGVILARRSADTRPPALEPAAHAAIAGEAAVATTASPGPLGTAAAPDPLGVDVLMKNVDKHRGEVVVEGIVSAAAQGRVSLIDCAMEECGEDACCKPLTLPVEWAGKPPEVKQRVRLHGKVRESEGNLSFAADKMEVVPPPAAKPEPEKE